MLISDWSSDVCSSDLSPYSWSMASTEKKKKTDSARTRVRPAGFPTREQVMDFIATSDQPAGKREIAKAFGLTGQEKRSEERRVGQECVSTCRSRWSTER